MIWFHVFLVYLKSLLNNCAKLKPDYKGIFELGSNIKGVRPELKNTH